MTKTLNKIMDVGQWILIGLLAVALFFTYTQNKEMSEDLVTNTEYSNGNEYVIVNKDNQISRLKKENKELYDSIKGLKNVSSAIQVKYKYRYVGDTVYVPSTKMAEDSIYRYSTNTDTISYDLTIAANNVRWHKLNFSLSDSLMIISRSKNGVNETRIVHSDPVDVTSATVFHPSKTFGEKVKDRVYVGVGVGAGYGVINKKPDVFIGIHAGIKLW